MRQRWPAVALGIAAAAVVGTAVPSDASTGPATITIRDRQTRYVHVGSGIGSREIARETLYSRDSARHELGHSVLVCTYVGATERSCIVTSVLPKGTIVAEGLLTSRLLYELAIVGGTGLYENARGTLTTTVIGLRPRRDVLLFRLAG
jgi:hypothetical protein